jgi:hypothetical protein
MICAMSVADLPIQIDREKIAEFCRGRGIRKLSLFGRNLLVAAPPDRRLRGVSVCLTVLGCDRGHPNRIMASTL